MASYLFPGFDCLDVTREKIKNKKVMQMKKKKKQFMNILSSITINFYLIVNKFIAPKISYFR